METKERREGEISERKFERERESSGERKESIGEWIESSLTSSYHFFSE